ncbi:dysbindin protein homolog [Leptidea sinapis]|uniref:dysbindin protein homolog n=1 Tax=Leptidea sinapis TaxID=189913 RepID=UPI002145C2A7|nr:dysbindin protein homolog [Leptidea sinapis]
MLGNLKDLISIVQDGLSSSNNLRNTLQEVQKVTNIFKDKQKVFIESKVNLAAGSALLEKYQGDWAEIHENADKNAKAAEEVDKLIIELHEVSMKKLKCTYELGNNLSILPGLTASVAQCMDAIKNVQILLKDVEHQLVEFEDIIERSKMEKWKLDHQYQLSLYKDKKMAKLEEARAKLTKENEMLSQERERKLLAELQAKRDNIAAAFQSDVAKYLSSGSLPISSGPPQTSLEQIQLDDDHTDLEKFLET